MRIQSIVTASVMALLCSIPAFADIYRDPQQRFEVDIPAGWAAEPFGEGVKLAHGGAYCLVMEGQAATPSELVNHLVRQFGGRWTRFQQVKQGSSVVAGQTAPFSFSSGVTPKGVPSFMKVLAVSAQGRLFALIASAPEAESASAKAGFDRIEQGFRLVGAVQPAPQMPAVGRPFIGVGIENSRSERGALVGAVAPGGPAEEAGIRAGDLIVAINRRPVTNPSAMPAALAGLRPGDILEFVIERGGRQSAVRVKMGVSQGR